MYRVSVLRRAPSAESKVETRIAMARTGTRIAPMRSRIGTEIHSSLPSYPHSSIVYIGIFEGSQLTTQVPPQLVPPRTAHRNDAFDCYSSRIWFTSLTQNIRFLHIPTKHVAILGTAVLYRSKVSLLESSQRL